MAEVEIITALNTVAMPAGLTFGQFDAWLATAFDEPAPEDIVVAVDGFGVDPFGNFGSLEAAVEFAEGWAADIATAVEAGRYRFFPSIAVVVRNRWGAEPREFARYVCKAA
jgi:hypothetical protein